MSARTVDILRTRVLNGGEVAADEALWLLTKAPKDEFHAAAHEITERLASRTFDFCAIISARQGRCPENCKWCAQSAHYHANCESHGWVGAEACIAAAKAAGDVKRRFFGSSRAPGGGWPCRERTRRRSGGTTAGCRRGR